MLPALLLCLAAARAVGMGSTDTVRIHEGGGAALRRALESAAQGSVVVVGPGTYQGPFVVTRPLELLGDGWPVLRGLRTGSVVRVAAPRVVLRGLVLEQGGENIDRDDAGVLVEGDSVQLEDLEIRDVLHGIYLKHVADVAIRGVVIRGRAERRPNDRGDGIHFYYSQRITAAGNDIADVRDGMYFSYSDSTVVRGNRVARSRYGLHYMFSHGNLFEDNRFTESAAGTSIMNSRDVVVRRNVFAWNRGIESFGLLQQTTERVRLEDNAFVGNGVGLFMDGAVDGVVRNNLVAENFIGLELYGSAERNRFAENAIVGNTYPATGAGRENRFCEAGRGNFWGERGYDLDADGVQDAPFDAAWPLTELSRERPALRLFLASPAATVLSWAERTFPIFDIEAVTDSCPLAAPPRALLTSHASRVPSHASRLTSRASRAAAAGSLLFGLGILFAAVPRSRP